MPLPQSRQKQGKRFVNSKKSLVQPKARNNETNRKQQKQPRKSLKTYTPKKRDITYEREQLVKITTQRKSKWKPVKASTVKSVMQVLESNNSTVLSMCTSRNYRQVETSLNTLKTMFARKLQKLEVPVSNEDSTTLLNEQVKAEETIGEINSHVSRMNYELDRLDQLMEEAEEEKSVMDKRLHISLQRIKQQSAIPELNHKALNLPPVITNYSLSDYDLQIPESSKVLHRKITHILLS